MSESYGGIYNMLNVHTTNQDAYITCNNALAQAKMLRPHVELLKPQVKNA